MDLDKKLTIEELSPLLDHLFGFWFDGDVLMDSSGDEFYGLVSNDNYDLTTLKGIFEYHKHLHQYKGAEDFKRDLRRIIGVK